jgi:hypothetical protein
LITTQPCTDARPATVGGPRVVAYEWRARKYPWALQKLAGTRTGTPAPSQPEPRLLPGDCECGCGQKTQLAAKTDSRYGRVKGQPMRFLNGHNSAVTRARPGGRPRCGDCGYITAECSCRPVTR